MAVLTHTCAHTSALTPENEKGMFINKPRHVLPRKVDMTLTLNQK